VYNTISVVIAAFQSNNITGLADKPTHGQSSLGLVNSLTSQLIKTFDIKFAVNNRYNVISCKLHY